MRLGEHRNDRLPIQQGDLRAAERHALLEDAPSPLPVGRGRLAHAARQPQWEAVVRLDNFQIDDNVFDRCLTIVKVAIPKEPFDLAQQAGNSLAEIPWQLRQHARCVKGGYISMTFAKPCSAALSSNEARSSSVNRFQSDRISQEVGTILTFHDTSWHC